MAPQVDEVIDGVDFGDNVDLPTFEQILDMDDGEDDRDFSRSIVFGFLDQADETFNKMDTSIAARDLPELSSLGHFLKGSSATLGFTKVKDECEKIQHWGSQKDETGTNDEPDADKCLRLITTSVAIARREFEVIAQLMRKYYDQP